MTLLADQTAHLDPTIRDDILWRDTARRDRIDESVLTVERTSA